MVIPLVIRREEPTTTELAVDLSEGLVDAVQRVHSFGMLCLLEGAPDRLLAQVGFLLAVLA